MADVFSPPGNFADYSAFIADANAINAATKAALNTALTNISNLITQTPTSGGTGGTALPHPDFNKIHPEVAKLIQNELTALKTAVTNHA